MSSPTVGPLTIEHLSQLRNAQDIIRNAKDQIELAKRAGIDVSAQEQQIADTETKLAKIKQVYFPGQ